MPSAQSLKELLIIRNENIELLEQFNSNLGTALGRKNFVGAPSILVFVPRKINEKWLSSQQIVPKILKGPHGLSCPTDVIPVVGYNSFWSGPPITGENLVLRDDLWGASDKLMLGSQLAYFDEKGKQSYGTLGCFVKDKSGNLGILTNAHNAGYVGNVMKHPYETLTPIAIVRSIINSVSDEIRFSGIIDEYNAYYTLDSAYAQLMSDINPVQDIQKKLTYINKSNKRKTHKLGSTYKLDLDTMDPIGKEVLGIGITRSSQRGKIFAFAYEYNDEYENNHYTDYLIENEYGEQFSFDGDSGKLIVTDDNKFQPIALLWGGNPSARLRSNAHEEDWTYAIDINIILEKLDLTIAR